MSFQKQGWKIWFWMLQRFWMWKPSKNLFWKKRTYSAFIIFCWSPPKVRCQKFGRSSCDACEEIGQPQQMVKLLNLVRWILCGWKWLEMCWKSWKMCCAKRKWLQDAFSAVSGAIEALGSWKADVAMFMRCLLWRADLESQRGMLMLLMRCQLWRICPENLLAAEEGVLCSLIDLPDAKLHLTW